MGDASTSATVTTSRSMAFGLWQELEDCTFDSPEAIKQARTFIDCLTLAHDYSVLELAKSKADHPAKVSA
jgi:hypothetical protein